MKVKELIKKLQQYNGETEVMIQHWAIDRYVDIDNDIIYTLVDHKAAPYERLPRKENIKNQWEAVENEYGNDWKPDFKEAVILYGI